MASSIKVKSQIDYNREILSRLKQICEPLKLLGISNFAYGLITKDKRFFRIGTHEKFTGLFFEHQLYDVYHTARPIKFTEERQTKYFLWKPDDLSTDLRLSVDIWNGVSGYNTTEDYIESWSMGGSTKDNQLPDFYINNTELLNRFIMYFKSVAKDIIDISDRQKTIDIIWGDSIDMVDEGAIARFNQQITTNKYFISKGKDSLSLTKRELECIMHKSSGFTAKQIARILNISPRTVETHFNNLKLKFATDHLSEILSVCKEEGLL